MSNWFDCLGETENWWGGGAAELCFTTLTHAVHNVLVTLCIEEQGRIQGGGGGVGVSWGTSKLHKVGGNIALMRAKTARFSTYQLTLLRNPVSSIR